MKVKQKNKTVVVFVVIFIVALLYGFFRFIYSNSVFQQYFHSLSLNRQQRIVKTMSVRVSPQIASSFLRWLKLPEDTEHDIAPILGESAYRAMGVQGFAICDGAFAIHCIRGVMTGVIQQFGYTPKVLSDATNSCLKYSILRDREAVCSQAAGYTILWLNLYWYIESLQYCERVFSDTSKQYNCWVGVSHENVQRVGDALHGLNEVPWSAANKHYPCDSIPLEYQPACVVEQIKVISTREFYGDRQQSIDYCRYFSHKETQKACISALDVQN